MIGRKWWRGIASLLALSGFVFWWTHERSVDQARQARAEAKRAFAAQRWPDLEKAAQRWSQSSPDSEAWLYLAEAQQRLGRPADAVSSLSRVSEDGPFCIQALVARQELEFGPLNRPLDAALTCERILSRQPQSEVAYQRLIFVAVMTLQRQKLERLARQAITLGCEPREAYLYLFFSDSQVLTNAVELNQRWRLGDPHSELFEVAHAVFKSEQLNSGVPRTGEEEAEAFRAAAAQVEQHMSQLLEKYPRNTELLAYHIQQAIQVGDTDRVAELLVRVGTDADADNRFWRFHGWLCEQHEQWADAEKAYRKGLELRPMDWGSRYLLAGLLRRRQQMEEVESLQKLVSRANTLRRELVTAANVRSVDRSLMEELASYARDCGDSLVGESLQRRLQQTAAAASTVRPENQFQNGKRGSTEP